MGTEGETEVDDDGRGLDEGGDKQDWPCFVLGVCSKVVEEESVECYSSTTNYYSIIVHKECTRGPPYTPLALYPGVRWEGKRNAW